MRCMQCVYSSIIQCNISNSYKTTVENKTIPILCWSALYIYFSLALKHIHNTYILIFRNYFHFLTFILMVCYNCICVFSLCTLICFLHSIQFKHLFTDGNPVRLQLLFPKAIPTKNMNNTTFSNTDTNTKFNSTGSSDTIRHTQLKLSYNTLILLMFSLLNI